MPHYIVTSGLTRRLVEADNQGAAIDEFLAARPMHRMVAGWTDDVVVRPAEDEEIVEYVRRRRAQFDGQVAFELNDARKDVGGRITKKEHA